MMNLHVDAETGILFPLLLTLITLFTLYWVSNKLRSEKEAKIPSFSFFPFKVPNFFDGCIVLYNIRKYGLQYYEELQSKHGNFYKLPLPLGKIILVSDPSIAQKVVSSSNPQHLNKPRLLYDIIFVPPLRDGLLASDYELWSTHRKILSRSFTYRSLQTYIPFMNEHAKSLVQELLTLCSKSKGGSVEGMQVTDLIWSETVKIIIQTVAGEDVLKDDSHLTLQSGFKRSKEIIQYRYLHPELKLIWSVHPKKKELDKTVLAMSEIIANILAKIREKQESNNGTYADLNDDNEEDEDPGVGVKPFKSLTEEMVQCGASPKEILDEFATIAAAGHETTSLAIHMLLFHLATNPKCQKLCRDEISHILKSDENGSKMNHNITMDDLTNLKYLERCIFEGLRLTAIVPFFLRQLHEPLELDNGIVLEANNTICISPWCMHRDPNTFPNPLKFDPDRFLPENVKNRHSHSFLPFSGGPRNCIGYKYAIMEIKVILAWLIQHFEVSTTDKPSEINYDTEITLHPDRDINIILKVYEPTD